jgi:hypothetical protein
MLFTKSEPIVDKPERVVVRGVFAPLTKKATGGTNAPIHGAHDNGDVSELSFNQGGNR